MGNLGSWRDGRSRSTLGCLDIDWLRRVGRLTERAVWALRCAAWQGMSLRYVRSIALHMGDRCAGECVGWVIRV
jgi:hypothetical protein